MFRAAGQEKGYVLVGLVMATFLLPALVLITTSIIQSANSATRYQKSMVTKQRMLTIKAWLVQQAKDSDNDGTYELPAEGAGNTLPTSIPISLSDEWGKAFVYCTWDLGSANMNTGYSTNHTTPPKANLIGRFISLGQNTTVETACSTATVPGGDDQMVDIFTSDTAYQNAGFGGWLQDSVAGLIRELNPADKVTIGTVSSPAAQLHVNSGSGNGQVIETGNGSPIALTLRRSDLGTTGDITLQNNAGELNIGNNIALLNQLRGQGSLASYGALTVTGTKNGYGGMNFRDSSNNNLGTLMMSQTYSGFYNAADNNWRFSVDDSGNGVFPGTVNATAVYNPTYAP